MNPFLRQAKKTLSLVLISALALPLPSAAGAVQGLAVPAPRALSSIPSWLLPPSSLGEISGSYGMARWQSGQSPLVLLVMDLHANAGVQRRIASLLGIYQKRLGPTHPFEVLVEGASGPVDLSLLADCPDRSLRTAVSELLLKEAELTGPAHYAIATGQGKLLYGVDDEKLHGLHLGLYRKSYETRKQILSALQPLSVQITSLKGTPLYPPPLRRLEKQEKRFQNGALPIAEGISRRG